MIEAIYKAHEVNQEIIRFIDKIVADCGKEKHLYASCAVPEELFAAIREDRSSRRNGRGCIHRRQADKRRKHP